MRWLAACRLLLSLSLGAARLFTGVVYGADSPMAYFVLKARPDAKIERHEASGRPVSKEIVLDSEEPQLSYGWLYFGLMGAVPILIAVMLAASVLLLVLDARRSRAA